MSDHVLRDDDIVVYLPVMHLELQTDEIGQYCCGACLCLDRCRFLPRDRADDWKSDGCLSVPRRQSGAPGIRTEVQWLIIDGLAERR